MNGMLPRVLARRRFFFVGLVVAMIAALLTVGTAAPAQATTASVTGSLIKNGVPVEDIWVTVYTPDGGVVDQAYSNGPFAFELELGQYTLGFYDSSTGSEYYYGSATRLEVAQTFAVDTGPVDLGSIEIVPSSISLHVLDPYLEAATGWATAYRLGADPDNPTGYGWWASAGLDGSGQARLVLGAGSYKVSVDDDVSGTMRWVNVDSQWALAKADATVFELTGTDIDLGTVVYPGPGAAQTVSGLVRDDNGNPLEGSVEIYQKDVYDDPADFQWFDEVYFANGEFSTELQPGTYKFRFDSYEFGVRKWYGGTTLSSATPVVVDAAPVSLDPVTFKTPASVQGVVRNGAGSPLSDMWVVLLDADGEYVTETVTGSTGDFFFEAVAEGSGYTVRVSDESGEYADAVSDAFAVPETGAVTLPDLTMLRRATVSGRVTAASGTPLKYVEVTAYDEYGDPLTSAVTDGQGNYTVRGLEAGDYRLGFVDTLGDYLPEFFNNKPELDLATVVPVAANQVVTGKNAVLAVDTSEDVDVDLQGTVRNTAGTPLAAVDVYAYDVDTGADHQTTTNRAGHYAFTDLATGTYTVQFTKWGDSEELPYVTQWFDGKYEANATAVAVVADDPVTANAQLRQYGAVTGELTNRAGEPLDGYVYAYDVDGDRVDDAYVEDGSYELRLPPGVYRLCFWGGDEEYASGESYVAYIRQWYDRARTFESARAVTVTSGATTTDVGVALTPDLEALVAPRITGSAIVGKTLTASTGEFNLMAGNTYGYQWRRGTTVVGTGATYVPKLADAGQKLTVTVTAHHEALAGTAVSAPTAAVKSASVVKVAGTSPRSRVVKLTVTVTVAGVANPGGTLTVKRGTTIVKRGVAVVNGRAVVTVTKQPRGRQRYSVSYSGTTKVLGGTASVLLRVRA